MFLLVDKPYWITSFDVLRDIRKKYTTKKVGHTGTLDPLATGLLLIATEWSTKLIPEVNTAKKRYTCTVRFDGKSDSLDAGTEITPTDCSWFQERSIEELTEFLLHQKKQMPPKYSALHIGWKRAYDLARKGESFELDERTIEVSDVLIESTDFPISITMSLTLSSGAYVRSFAPILWSFFDVAGWYISILRRTHIYLENGVTLNEDMIKNLDVISEIPYSTLFPTIHTIKISEYEYINALNWANLILWNSATPKMGDRYFLKYKNEIVSLCIFNGETYTILKNKI